MIQFVEMDKLHPMCNLLRWLVIPSILMDGTMDCIFGRPSTYVTATLDYEEPGEPAWRDPLDSTGAARDAPRSEIGMGQDGN